MSHPGESLLDAVRGLLERTYGRRSPIGDLAPFLIGDDGFRRFYGSIDAATSVRATAELARTFVRETGGVLRASVYYPDALIARLERNSPWRGLGEENVEAFAALVEELDHLLVLAERVAAGRSCSLFELELHANVSKYLVLSRFLPGGATGRRRNGPESIWLRWHLFHRGTWADPDSGVRERYREAARWALRFLDAVERVRGRAERLRLLRRFHDTGPEAKIELIRTLVVA